MRVAAALIVAALALAACGRSSDSPPLTKPQHDALDKAKNVGKVLRKEDDAMRKKIDDESK